MKLYDCHCHLDLFQDMNQTFDRLNNSNLTVITMTTTPKAWERNKILSTKNKNVFPALGMHPQLIGQRIGELGLFLDKMKETNFIGEIGIDANKQYVSTVAKQAETFNRIIEECNFYGDKIISIHSVKATKLVLNSIKEKLNPNRATVILHWFTGNEQERILASSLECYFSINKKMINTINGKNLISKVPLDKILTETDSPFIDQNCTLERMKIDIIATIDAIAKIRGLKIEEMSLIIEENFMKLMSKVNK